MNNLQPKCFLLDSQHTLVKRAFLKTSAGLLLGEKDEGFLTLRTEQQPGSSMG